MPEKGRLEERPSVAMKTFYFRILILAALVLPSAAQAQRMDPVYIEDRLQPAATCDHPADRQIEQLQYRNQQLQQQMEKMQADYEYRLDTLEKGKPGGGAPRPPRAAAAAANGQWPRRRGGGSLAPPANNAAGSGPALS
jgi:hypothetical protein